MLNALRRSMRSGRQAPVAPEPDLSGLSAADRPIVERAYPYTMTGVPRLQALIDAVRYCVARGVEGAFAECGVWRGGSVLAMVLTLRDLGVTDRDIYLYDTFEGMTRPTEVDVSRYDLSGGRPTEAVGCSALAEWEAAQERGLALWEGLFGPESFSEEGVRETLSRTGYPDERLHFVRGPVEETLPDRAPSELALLRLDTDWYESTHHELLHLYPRLVRGGVFLVDDYGHWEGSRRAVDEYFATVAPPLLLNRIDYSARIAVKA
jgi:O-methyltransferase